MKLFPQLISRTVEQDEWNIRFDTIVRFFKALKKRNRMIQAIQLATIKLHQNQCITVLPVDEKLIIEAF